MDKDFKEIVPLLIFTGLAVIAAGLTTACHFYTFDPELSSNLLLLSLILLITGGAFSFLHLGKKGRAVRSLIGLPHSWLSREIALLTLYGLALTGTVAAIKTEAFQYTTSLHAMATVLALVLCLTIGMVYNLSSQLAWRGIVNLLQPVTGALVLASVLFIGKQGMEARFISLIVVDLILSLIRYRRFAQLRQLDEIIVFEKEYERAAWVWLARQSAWAFMVTAVIFGYPLAAGVLASAVILMDRFLFYAAAVRLTPGNIIAGQKKDRMEAALK